MSVRAPGAEPQIVRRWFNRRTVPLSLFAALWIGGAGYFSWSWLTQFGAQPLLPLSADPVLVPLALLLLVGIGMAYRAAAEWLNRSELRVARHELSVRHGPLPWPGYPRLTLTDVKALDVRKSLWSTGGGTGRARVHSYELHALTGDRKTRRLLGGFDTPAQSL